MKYLLTFVVYVKRILDPMQLLFDTFGLHIIFGTTLVKLY